MKLIVGLLLTIGFSSTTGLRAQALAPIKPLPVQTWLENGSSIYQKHETILYLTGKKRNLSYTLPAWPYNNPWSFCEGYCYTIRFGTYDKIKKEYDNVDLVRTPNGKDFEVIGHFDRQATNLPDGYIFPLGKPNLFLGIGFMRGMIINGTGSFAAIYRMQDNGLVGISSLVQMDLETSIFNIVKNLMRPSSRPMVELKKEYSALYPFIDTPIVGKNHILISSARAGIFWIIDKTTGNLKRTVRLYPIKEKELSSTSKIESAILGIQPKQDGNFVIAARDQNAFFGAGNTYDHQRADSFSTFNKPIKPDDSEEYRKRELKESLPVFGDVTWWELDPDNGKFERIFPNKADQKIKTPLELHNFCFYINSNDNVVMGAPSQLSSSKPQAPVGH